MTQSERRFRGVRQHNIRCRISQGSRLERNAEPQGRGHTRQQLGFEPQSAEEHIHPDSQPWVKEAIRAAIHTKSAFEVEHRILRDDGTSGWIFSRAVPLLDESGEIMEWFGTASDVTARKQAETKLQAQLARLALLSEITRAIGERQDIKSIFQVVIRTLEEQLPVDFCSICLCEPEAQELTITGVGRQSEPLAIELAADRSRAHIPIDHEWTLPSACRGNWSTSPIWMKCPSRSPNVCCAVASGHSWRRRCWWKVKCSGC